MNERMLTLREICAAKRTSPPNVYRLIARGLLPPGERTGLRSVRWRESVVEAAYLRLNADRPSVAVVKQPGETSPQSDLEAAAARLASQENPPMPVLPHVRTIFGLTPAATGTPSAAPAKLPASKLSSSLILPATQLQAPHDSLRMMSAARCGLSLPGSARDDSRKQKTRTTRLRHPGQGH